MYRVYQGIWGLGFRVHVPNIWALGFWVIVIIVLVLGKYMIIRYLDPYGYRYLDVVETGVMAEPNLHWTVWYLPGYTVGTQTRNQGRSLNPKP